MLQSIYFIIGFIIIIVDVAVVINIIICMSFLPPGVWRLNSSDMKYEGNKTISYLLSIVRGPWQKGGHMKHDFSTMELCIHRMFTSGVICQSNFH